MQNPACRQAKNARDAVYFLALSVNSGLQRRSTVGSLSVTRRINGVQTATYDAECAYIIQRVGREREGESIYDVRTEGRGVEQGTGLLLKVRKAEYLPFQC